MNEVTIFLSLLTMNDSYVTDSARRNISDHSAMNQRKLSEILARHAQRQVVMLRSALLTRTRI